MDHALEERRLEQAAELSVCAGKRTVSCPALELTSVSLNAIFSASEPLILRNMMAADMSEDTVAAVNASPVESVRLNLTPC